MPTGIYERIKHYKWSEEAKQRNKGKPPVMGMLGKHHTEATKQKIREKRKLQVFSKETRLKFKNRRPCLGKHWKIKDTSKMKGRKGEKSPSWKGGLSFEKYNVDWTESLRISIRERDKYVCKICGNKQGDEAFSVHHIDYNKKNCDPKNLITLCRKCHAKTSYNRNYWINCFNK